MTLFAVILYLLIGTIAGLLSGLLGVGGGVFVVPALLFVFHLEDIQTVHTMQTAAATSLAAMIFTTASSARTHYLQNGIKWNILIPLIPGIIIGAILGAIIAFELPSKFLILIFGCFIFLVGSYFLLFPNLKELQGVFTPRVPIFCIIGLIIGIISTSLGIGGGIITVPTLATFQIPLRTAISISAITSLLMAIIGSISFLLLGITQETIEGSFGFLYWPAFICIGMTSSFTAYFAAILSNTLPVETLKRIFGIFLVTVGIFMFFR